MVIGSGPGGYVASIKAAQLGMKVSAVEMSRRLLEGSYVPEKVELPMHNSFTLVYVIHQTNEDRQIWDFAFHFALVSSQ